MRRKILLFASSLLVLVRVSYSAETSPTNLIYFLVGERPGLALHNDSYLLPLSQPSEIEHARDVINRGASAGRNIVIAKIVVGKDGVNRNYTIPMCAEWSWHVVKFQQFADITAETLDGWPTRTELEAQGSPPGYESLIGYWSYTVIKELGSEPICLTCSTNLQGLQFTWYGVSTNYVYTLESTGSLSSTNWTPVSGGPWPSRTNQWSVPLALSSNRFFRVKAQLQP